MALETKIRTLFTAFRAETAAASAEEENL